MGYMCSYIAVKGVAKSDLLDAVGMVETDEPMETLPASREFNFSYRERPNGWTILFSEDFDWFSRKRILDLSHLGLVVGCQFEDKAEMTSVATAAQNGVELWRVFHNSDPRHVLDVSGDPPAEFAAIRDRLFRQEEEEGGADYIHDIPMALMHAECGYRPDEDMDEEMFRALKPIGADDDAAHYGGLHRSVYGDRPSGPGLLSSILGIFKRK